MYRIRQLKNIFFLFHVPELKLKTGNTKTKTASVSHIRIYNFAFSLQGINELIIKTSKTLSNI